MQVEFLLLPVLLSAKQKSQVRSLRNSTPLLNKLDDVRYRLSACGTS